MAEPYDTGLTDSARWDGFVLRPGDIVISTPAKCGTTWMQMICALLVFQTVDLPGPLTALSPWLDMRGRPLDEIRSLLAAQEHRRFIKTHTPLDGLPMADGVHYIVVGRDPRDVAVSIDHHRANVNKDVMRRLHTGRTPPPPRSADRRERILAWIDDDKPPQRSLTSLRGMVWHLAQAWRRRDEPHVILMHYADLLHDLDGQMRHLAATLGIEIPADRWRDLVAAATFDRMRARSGDFAPHEDLRLFTDPAAFFHKGSSGQWRDVFTVEDLAHYERRLAQLAEPDVIAWLQA